MTILWHTVLEIGDASMMQHCYPLHVSHVNYGLPNHDSASFSNKDSMCVVCRSVCLSAVIVPSLQCPLSSSAPHRYWPRLHVTTMAASLVNVNHIYTGTVDTIHSVYSVQLTMTFKV